MESGACAKLPHSNDNSPSAGDPRLARLSQLADKYDLLIALSRGTPGRTAERRAAMQALSSRFPGALREWDTQPLSELVRRRMVVRTLLLEAAAQPFPALFEKSEAWLRYAVDLHFHLREVLRLRRFLVLLRRRQRSGQGAGDPPIEDDTLSACQRFYEREGQPVFSFRLTAARLRHIESPPGGRLQSVAYADVAEHHGVSIDAIKDALFEPAERSKEVHGEKK
jgi:hypothetical protein